MPRLGNGGGEREGNNLIQILLKIKLASHVSV